MPLELAGLLSSAPHILLRGFWEEGSLALCATEVESNWI